jgi:hypothetical protein
MWRLVRIRVIAAVLVLGTLVSLSSFLAAAQHSGPSPVGDFTPRRVPDWHLSGPDAERQRQAWLAEARVRVAPDEMAHLVADITPLPSPATRLNCRFLNEPPSGTTAKFNCVLDGGAVIKVKYGRNPEIQGEVAGTRLLRLMGFAADDVEIVPRLRCYGCPREPFLTAVFGTMTKTLDLLGPRGFDNGYSDFEWVAVERRFPAPAIETDQSKGWAFWEVRNFTSHRADLDALRLLAVFMAHWDNKAENQRLVCLDRPATDAASTCRAPLLMLQDLGATFGPTKVNLGSWPTVPIWADRSTCRVSMRSLPWNGGTFADVDITEAGRRQIADRLGAITDEDLRTLFQAARFPEFQSATDDARDLREWIAAFKSRARQIIDAGPCPTSGPEGSETTDSQTEQRS